MQRKSKLWIWIALIIIFAFGIWAYSNPDNFKLNQNIQSSPSIKDLSLNPQNYIGQNVTLKGSITYASAEGKAYRLKDKNNYYVLIDPNSCVWGVQRQYKYDGSETYTAIGTFLEGDSVFYGNFYYLQCSTHLE